MSTMSKKEMKRIVPLRGANKELMIKFECTADTVSRALNYKSFTLKSEAIRQYAIDYYEGKLIIQNVRAKKVKSTKKQKK